MKKGILAVPIGEIGTDVLEALERNLGAIFKREVVLAAAMDEPSYAINRQRGQYSAEMILVRLSANAESRAYERTIGVVAHDLYVNNLNFVFGIASGQHALISTARLQQEFYGGPADESIFEKRLLTEAVHELGHTYGLGHCPNDRCVMYFSNRLSDTDRKGFEFCSLCKGRVP